MSFGKDQFAGSMGSGGQNYARQDGFDDTEPGVESYGAGPGSGAYDPANTGLGGYGNMKSSDMGHPTSTGLGGGGSNDGSNAGEEKSSGGGGTDEARYGTGDLGDQLRQAHEEGKQMRERDDYGGEAREGQELEQSTLTGKVTGAAGQFAQKMRGEE